MAEREKERRRGTDPEYILSFMLFSDVI